MQQIADVLQQAEKAGLFDVHMAIMAGSEIPLKPKAKSTPGSEYLVLTCNWYTLEGEESERREEALHINDYDIILQMCHSCSACFI